GWRDDQTSERLTMAIQADVRRIALALRGSEESQSDFAFGVRVKGKLKGFAWVWKERITPKKPRVPNPAVLAVRTPTVGAREALIAAEPTKFFTEPHYEGFPAVLVRLAAVNSKELRILLEEAWRCQAPKELRNDIKPTVKRSKG
ncbi:MAG TPA: hypothetical protein VLB12_06365, partial [Gemmatimonadales bacterium]|nr:hypothetical protein [Gemmatimonadales bacterium]